MKFIKALRNTFVIIMIFGVITALIDYYRMINGYVPIYSRVNYNEKSRIETYRGLFYVAERKIKLDRKERLSSSDNLKYKFLIYELDIKKVYNLKKYDYIVLTQEQEKCDSKSKLLYADLNRKYYTYCIDSIKIKELSKEPKELLSYVEKNDEIIKELESEMQYTGLYKDGTTQIYKSEKEVMSNHGLTMYICNKKNINDVYIVPKDIKMNENDFCVYKDDDFDFLWTITEEKTPDGIEYPKDEDGNIKPEAFLEDDINRYEFSEPKKDRIFITVPEVRGKKTVKIPLMEILKTKRLSLEQLKERGLVYNTINKEEEKKRLEEERKKKEEEAKKKAEEEKKKQEENQPQKTN